MRAPASSWRRLLLVLTLLICHVCICDTSLRGAAADEKELGKSAPETTSLGEVTSSSSSSSSSYSLRRFLSQTFNWFTGQSQVTKNGKIPVTDCPMGYYRPQGGTSLKMVTGPREDGCLPCPRGKYGSTTGLTTSSCTASCPLGTYSSRVARTSALECELCPPNTYGLQSGLTTSACSGTCKPGTYSKAFGATRVTACVACQVGSNQYPCNWANLPAKGQVQGHLHGFNGGGVPKNFVDPLAQK